eukprot:gnl/MRDRNA2_/MRDRNA2_145262_c0_seq1.p1 gnl/MRDRNA2_/MRDRNA2_145262_c0~~gnl/MRDRNA2_/MRDRNA2_145262_c0_seq1.p1  ORF type:complete len:235 (-),score=21.69 gnl/MRDRNA2_/MRDRNA2_145262_c0_seq1:45-680(-)
MARQSAMEIEPYWIGWLPFKHAWDCIAPDSEVEISHERDGSYEVLYLPFGGLYRDRIRTLVIFTSEPSQPWYKSALKVGTGVAFGAATVAAIPSALGVAVGVKAAGPIAGGMLAGKMASGGVAAGSALATAQSVVMGGLGNTTIAGGGAVGGVLSKLGFGRGKRDYYLKDLPRSDVHICGKSGKVYVGLSIPADAKVFLLRSGSEAPLSRL